MTLVHHCDEGAGYAITSVVYRLEMPPESPYAREAYGAERRHRDPKRARRQAYGRVRVPEIYRWP